MWRSRIVLLLVLPVALLLMAFRQVPLADPAPITVPAKVTSAQVEKAVKQALVKRQWLIVSDAPGKIVASYAPRDFSVQIGIRYDTAQIQISYISSTNLKYEEKNGQRWIHKNYPSWIQNLVTDITGNLSMAAF